MSGSDPWFISIEPALTKGGESIVQTHPWLIKKSLKNNTCEHEWQNDFHDVKPFVLIFANQIKEDDFDLSYIFVRSSRLDFFPWHTCIRV